MVDQSGQVADSVAEAGPDRVLEGVEHEFGGHGGGGSPADDPAGEDVDDEGDVDGAGPGRDVGEVGDPQLVRGGRGEVTIDQIGSPGIALEMSPIALAGEEVIGFATLIRRPDGLTAEHRIAAVLPEWRRKGVATALLRGQPYDQVSLAVAAMARLMSWSGVVLIAADGLRTHRELSTVIRRLIIAASCFALFGLVQVFSGQTAPADYNKAWWSLREQYQGIAPPTTRDETAFDPGAKYHIPGNVPYARYFLARILQYQFYKAACDISGWNGPLHRCSFYGSKEVGQRLNAMLAMGQSQPWQDALQAFTGERQMDGSAILAYYAPLITWLKEQNTGARRDISYADVMRVKGRGLSKGAKFGILTGILAGAVIIGALISLKNLDPFKDGVLR